MTKIIVIVHDNACNVVSGLRMLEEKHGVTSLRCAGHTQLVVNHALKDAQISKALGAARCLVEHKKKVNWLAPSLEQSSNKWVLLIISQFKMYQ